MRLLHTADWHLGRQFHNISLLEDQRELLGQLVGLLEREQVDAVLLAGDVYDRSVPPAGAVALLDQTLNTICCDLQIPLIMIAGNHDSPERLGFGARPLQQAGLHLIGNLWEQPMPVTLDDQHGPVHFYPIPYADPARVRALHGVEVHSHDQAMAHLTQTIRDDLQQRSGRSVVMAHCFLAGFSATDSERPLCVGGTEQVSAAHFTGFDYVALGHLHGPQARGAEHIRYAGSLMKYSFSEQHHDKSVTLVDLGPEGVEGITAHRLTPTRDLRTIEGGLDDLMAQGSTDPGREDYLQVRLTDRHAILDIMGKLRTVYPNVLHLERPFFMPQGEGVTPKRELLRQGEMSMFRDFYRQASGQELSAEQEQLVGEILTAVHRGEAG